jgi:outer membrane protein
MKKIFVISFLFLGFSVAKAQEIQLTFQEAVNLALQTNVEYRIQENEYQRADMQRWQGLGNLLPNVRLTGDVYERIGRQQITNPETDQVEFRDAASQNIDLRLNASMVLFNGLNRIQTLLASHNRLIAQKHALERSRQSTIFNVAQQYLQVLLSEELYKIALDNYRNQQETLKRIEVQVDIEALALVDKYNQLAEVKRFESLVIQTKNTWENDKANLAQILQLSPGTDFQLVKPEVEVNSVLYESVSLAQLYQIALHNRPDYKQQMKTLEASERNLWARRGTYMPTVSAFYTYGTFYNSTVPFSRTDQLRTVFPSHFYGLSFSVPIFGGLETRSAVQSAKIDRNIADLNEQNQRSIIYRDVQTAWQNFEASKAGYYAASAQLEAASTAHELESERYRLGASSFIEYSQANNALVQAQAAYAQAIFTLIFQQTILNFQTGVLTELSDL